MNKLNLIHADISNISEVWRSPPPDPLLLSGASFAPPPLPSALCSQGGEMCSPDGGGGALPGGVTESLETNSAYKYLRAGRKSFLLLRHNNKSAPTPGPPPRTRRLSGRVSTQTAPTCLGRFSNCCRRPSGQQLHQTPERSLFAFDRATDRLLKRCNGLMLCRWATSVRR